MIPHELSPRKLKLPETDSPSIVLITRDSLMHQRFAYRIQKEFGDLVLAWYEFRPKSSFAHAKGAGEKLSVFSKKAKEKLPPKIEGVRRYIRSKGLMGEIKLSFIWVSQLLQTLFLDTYLLEKYRRRLASYEKKLFGEEIKELKRYAKLSPIAVEDPGSKEFIEDVRKLNPYFFLSLGGPLYKKELLESIRGIAINQHAGWSPAFKGGNTIEWALYHRSLNYVGNTVHITTTGADAGPILRRSHTCLISEDTPETCFARTVALGIELLIEVVGEIISNKETVVYDQPINEGLTCLGSRLDGNILKAIYRDFSNSWLKKELLRIRSF